MFFQYFILYILLKILKTLFLFSDIISRTTTAKSMVQMGDMEITTVNSEDQLGEMEATTANLEDQMGDMEPTTAKLENQMGDMVAPAVNSVN